MGKNTRKGAPLARTELRVLMEEVLKRTARIGRVPGKVLNNAMYPAGRFSVLPLMMWAAR